MIQKRLSATIVFVAALLLFISAASARKALQDDALDMITAAGEPKVLISSNGSVEHADESVFNLALVSDAQSGIRALTVQNVVGEVQLLVNLNILSVSGDLNNSDQRNFAVQSWGSTLPILSESEEGESAVEGDAELEGCIGCTQINTAAPAQIRIGSASGDVIIQADGTVDYDEEPVFNLVFEPNAQQDFSTLFVANLVGRVQTAFNINVASSTLNLFPSTDQPFANPFANGTGTIRQVNSGVQFRGTPINAQAAINIDHVPTP